MAWTVRAIVALVCSVLLTSPNAVAAGSANTTIEAGRATHIAATAEHGSATVEGAIAERTAFGLPADYATVADLLGSYLDVGTPRWGIPMTAEEERVVDLPARMTFAGHAKEAAIPYAQKLPGFAGVYFDQSRGGRLVVVMVGDGHEVEQQIVAGLLPAGGPGVEFQEGRHTFAELHSAWSAAYESWTSDIPLRTAGIDERANMIWLEVSEVDLAATAGMADDMESRLGVSIGIRAAESSEEVGCTTREDCASPMRAGNVIHNDDEFGFRCTMGFHVTNGAGDRQFVTSGHCGFAVPDDWYHQGMPANGLIGNVTNNLYANSGVDIMRVQMPNAQVSRNVWGSAWLVTFTAVPSTGEAICASRGIANLVDCGTVETVYFFWGPGGTLCDCVQQGADASGISAIGGDSGSPIYRILNQQDVAIGSLSTTAGYFAEVVDALSFWGGSWEVYGT